MRYFAEAIRETPPLSLLIGESESGDFIFADMEKTPHLFVSGVTGSGKSVFIRSVLLSAMLKNKVDNLRFILFDSKLVEFSNFNQSSHMFIPTITNFDRLIEVLDWAVFETYKRLKLFVDYGARSITEYRKYQDDSVPRILIVLDDLTSALKFNPELYDSISEILLKGRTVGIHLITVTQHAAERRTKEIAKLIPSKVLFLTLSEKESKMLIGNSSALNLGCPGHAVYSAYRGEASRVRIVAPSPEESELILSASRKVFQGYSNDTDIIPLVQNIEDKSDDELLYDVVDVILETGQASTSMLERKLKLGYQRASKILDQLEEKGYVGPFEGTKPRSILITKERWSKWRIR